MDELTPISPAEWDARRRRKQWRQAAEGLVALAVFGLLCSVLLAIR